MHLGESMESMLVKVKKKKKKWENPKKETVTEETEENDAVPN